MDDVKEEMPVVAKTGQPLLTQGPEGESPRQANARQERELQRYNEWSSKSCPERTQIASDRQYPTGKGKHSYGVCIPGDKAQPHIVIRADSKEVAQARYLKLCGIRSTDHEVSAVRVNVAQEAAIREAQPFPKVLKTDYVEQEEEDDAA